MNQAISIQQTRDNLASIIEEVAVAKKSFLITKFGKAKALIVPIEGDQNSQKQKMRAIKALKGIWADRAEMKNSTKWLKDQRKKMSTRYGKVFA